MMDCPVDTLEVLFLNMVCLDTGVPTLVGAGNIGAEIPYGPGAVTVYEVWWDSRDGLDPVIVDGSWMVNLIVYNTDTEAIVDVLSLAINSGPL